MIMACFLIGTVLSALFLVNARISGRSMLPGLMDGDMCTGLKGTALMSYGSIAIIDDRDYGRILVKRVIGIGGDEIEVLEDGHVLRNGVLLEEPYVLEQSPGGAGIYNVPDGMLFVLGDNRGESADSRKGSIGCISEDRVIGIIMFRFWPLDRIGILQ